MNIRHPANVRIGAVFTITPEAFSGTDDASVQRYIGGVIGWLRQAGGNNAPFESRAQIARNLEQYALAVERNGGTSWAAAALRQAAAQVLAGITTPVKPPVKPIKTSHGTSPYVPSGLANGTLNARLADTFRNQLALAQQRGDATKVAELTAILTSHGAALGAGRLSSGPFANPVRLSLAPPTMSRQVITAT